MSKENRVENANKLINTIASCGRKFFSHNGRVSRIELDLRGRIWFVDAYKNSRVYTHDTAGRWRGFSEGGTLRDVVIRLREYIRTGDPIHEQFNTFGPWPQWYSEGDPWGYGNSMKTVRDVAVALGIIPARVMPNVSPLRRAGGDVMGKCSAIIDEVRFDTRDPELTHVYVAVHGVGDCPIQLDGWHHKVFPARISSVEILQKHFSDFLEWSLEAPFAD